MMISIAEDFLAAESTLAELHRIRGLGGEHSEMADGLSMLQGRSWFAAANPDGTPAEKLRSDCHRAITALIRDLRGSDVHRLNLHWKDAIDKAGLWKWGG